MNKKVLRAGAVSAVAAGVGAAAVMAGKRRSKKKRQTAIIVIQNWQVCKKQQGIYYTNGNYEAFYKT